MDEEELSSSNSSGSLSTGAIIGIILGIIGGILYFSMKSYVRRNILK